MFKSKYLRFSCAILPTFRNNHTIPKGRLQGKVAIVTGSTKGIGLGIAERLAQEGAKVIISSRHQDNVDHAVQMLASKKLDVSGLVCHVAKPEDRKNLFDEANKYGGADILVSNVAVNPEPGPMLNTSEAAWDKIFDVNVKSSFLLSQEAIPTFRKKGGGNIVFISSFVAYQPPVYVGIGAYSVSKTALLGLTKALAIETATENIRVNCVCPGLVYTKFGSIIFDNEANRSTAEPLIPMKRAGQPHEISGCVAFLVGDDSKFITGESIVVAGGGPSRL